MTRILHLDLKGNKMANIVRKKRSSEDLRRKFIDIIDAKSKELVWQGEGSGYLTKDTNKKDERIKEFVSKILAQYPPIKK